MIVEIGFQLFVIILMISVIYFVFLGLLKEFYIDKDWFGVGLISLGILTATVLLVVSIDLLWKALLSILS